MANYSIEKYANTTEADSYTVNLSPDALALSVSGGTVTHLNPSATISVYKGSTQLQAVSGSTPGSGQFAVDQSAITDTNITKGSQSVSGTDLVFAATSSMSQTTASIDYPINIENVITITRTQNYSQTSAGSDGDDGHSGFLTNPAHVVSADNDGTNYSLSGAGGTFKRFDGGTDKTGSDTTYYVGASGTSTSATQNGLTFSITQSTGVYALSGGSWTSDEEQFTVRAIYDSVTITAVYSIAKAKDGDSVTGAAGLRTIQGYLYYEKTSNVGTAPSAPSYTTYTISSGDINGGSGATEVLGLSDTSATDKWTNQPRTHSATSSNSHWTVRYFGTESSAGSSTITVSYSNVVKQTSFSGVVTFSGGTFSEDGSAVYDTTTIDGGHITSGTIAAARISTDLLRVTGDAMTGGTVGGITVSSDKIYIGTGTHNNSNTAFYVDDDGQFSLKDKLSWDGTTLSINGNITMANQGSINISGFNNNSGYQTNTSNKTGGEVGGWTISSTAITGTKVTIDNTNDRILIED